MAAYYVSSFATAEGALLYRGMANVKVSALMDGVTAAWLAAGTVCGFFFSMTFYQLLDEANNKLSEDRAFSLTIIDTFHSFQAICLHRKFYPESHLRLILAAWAAGLIACGIGAALSEGIPPFQ